MIDLSVNGKNLAIKEESISLRLANPLFNDVSEHSFPFSLIHTAETNALLQYPGVISQRGNSNYFESVLKHNNTDLFQGEIEILESGKNSSDVYFKSGRGRFNAVASEIKLTEIEYENTLAAANDYAAALTDLTNAAKTNNGIYTCFPVYAPNFFGSNTSTDFFINPYYDIDFNELVEATENEAFVPFFYLHFVLTKIFEKLEFELNDQVFKYNEEFRKLTVFNLFRIRLLQDKPITISFANNLPNVTVTDFIKSVENTLAIKFIPDWHSKVVHLVSFNSIINESDIRELPIPSGSPMIIKTNWKGFKLSKKTASKDSFASEKVINELNHIQYQGSVDSFTDIIFVNYNIGDLVLVKEENSFYRKPDTGSTFVFHSFLFDIYNDGEYEINAESDSPMVDTVEQTFIVPAYDTPSNPSTIVNGEYIRNLFVPRTDESGDDAEDGSYDTIRFLIYHGMQSFDASSVVAQGSHTLVNPLSGTYPFASPFNYDYDHNRIGDLSLSWHLDDGMFENYFKQFLYWKSVTKKIELETVLESSFLKSFSFYEKIRIDNQNYLVDTIEAELGKGPIRAKLTLWTI